MTIFDRTILRLLLLAILAIATLIYIKDSRACQYHLDDNQYRIMQQQAYERDKAKLEAETKYYERIKYDLNAPYPTFTSQGVY